jgi:hypothetical protein
MCHAPELYHGRLIGVNRENDAGMKIFFSLGTFFPCNAWQQPLYIRHREGNTAKPAT